MHQYISAEERRKKLMTADEIRLSKNKPFWMERARQVGIQAMFELAVLEKRCPRLPCINTGSAGGASEAQRRKKRDRELFIFSLVKRRPGMTMAEISAQASCSKDVTRDTCYEFAQRDEMHKVLIGRLITWHPGPDPDAK